MNDPRRLKKGILLLLNLLLKWKRPLIGCVHVASHIILIFVRIVVIL